jgi:tetrahydromethanopterin S-methyltransferase subunit F
MENLDLLNNDLQVSPASQTFLSEAARWGRFLSIIGFIFCGLIVVMAFFIPTLIMNIPPYNQLASGMTSAMSVGITIGYLLASLLLFFPCLYLYKFSVKMKVALNAISQENFETSLQNLKSLLKFYGILAIILLSFYALVFVIGMLGLAMNG